MSILVGRGSKVLVQGITGRDGSFHAKQMKEYGTKVVAGVTPAREERTSPGSRCSTRSRKRWRRRAPTCR
jgi:succinyl-CoA synthetase alpha subunit